jgi:hypothetical protein
MVVLLACHCSSEAQMKDSSPHERLGIPWRAGYHWFMATAVKRLDLTIGEFVEIAGRRYEVVPDREGGVAIEPAITPAAQLHAQRGTKPASAEDFERLSADVPYDDEG